jgi:hypothetical protein
MTFHEARAFAQVLGAKCPTYDEKQPVAQCWIDRIQWAVRCKHGSQAREDAIEEANRYSGHLSPMTQRALAGY